MNNFIYRIQIKIKNKSHRNKQKLMTIYRKINKCRMFKIVKIILIKTNNNNKYYN